MRERGKDESEGKEGKKNRKGKGRIGKERKG